MAFAALLRSFGSEKERVFLRVLRSARLYEAGSGAGELSAVRELDFEMLTGAAF